MNTDPTKRVQFHLDASEQRALAIGRAIKFAAGAAVCVLLTVIGVSANETTSPVVGNLPPAASAAPAPANTATARLFAERRERFAAARGTSSRARAKTGSAG